jgi:predicted nuclease of predicted toxin-antitoxin system
VKFKLDENIGRRGLELLRSAGHDAVTVRDEGLAGAPDEQIFSAAASESRALITLDYDFAQVLRFPPHTSAGIVVLELGGRASLEALLARLRAMLANLESHPIAGRLWIIEAGRVRMHLRSEGEDDETG